MALAVAAMGMMAGPAPYAADLDPFRDMTGRDLSLLRGKPGVRKTVSKAKRHSRNKSKAASKARAAQKRNG